MRRQGMGMVAAAITLALLACQELPEPTVSLTQEQWKQVRTHVLPERPEPEVEVGAVFGQEGEPMIELVGYDVSGSLITNKPITITWYWRALRDMEKNWKVFVHLNPKKGGSFQNLDHHPVEGLYQTSLWEEGSYIKDVQTVTLRAGFPSGGAWIDGGFFDEQGGARLPLLDAGGKEVVGEHQVRFGDVSTKNDKVIKAYRVSAPPTLDGKLDDAAWDIAKPGTGLFVAASDGSGVSATMSTKAQVVYTSSALYVAFDARDRDIRTTYRKRDDTLWKQDAIEIYLNPDNDEGTYWELQISPGTGISGAQPIFDAYFQTHRAPKWEESKRHNLAGLEAAVHRRGTLNSAGTRLDDIGYTMEVKIPFAGLLSTPGAAKQITGVNRPPRVGDTWRVNFFRVEYGYSGRELKTTHSAWSPPGRDFHNLQAFGTLEFRETRAVPKKTPPKGASKTPEGPRLDLKVQVFGGVQSSSVDASIRKNEAALQACLEGFDAKGDAGKEAASVRLDVKLAEPDAVASVEPSGVVLSEEVTACVVKLVEGWRVPRQPQRRAVKGAEKKDAAKPRLILNLSYTPPPAPNARRPGGTVIAPTLKPGIQVAPTIKGPSAGGPTGAEALKEAAPEGKEGRQGKEAPKAEEAPEGKEAPRGQEAPEGSQR